ncbi:hypothetical protein C2E23DRAFT_731568 [Lenzites betulinus]|nr:hypothetical protein C2E23DRAFT_731568 [Lenzites betulinus]
MPGLALLSPINESEEFSPYQRSFRRGQYSGQRSPIAKSPFHHVRDTIPNSPGSADVSVDDLWIYDCYVSEDATSPGGYPCSPSTTHSRSISLPSTTAGLSPTVTVPVARVPSPSIIRTAPPPASADTQLLLEYDDSQMPSARLAYDYSPLITTTQIAASVFSPESLPDYPEYSPLEQEAMSIWEVIDQLAAAADQLAGLDAMLTDVRAADPTPSMDEDVVFWFIEGLNLLIGDCTEVSRELMQFNELVEKLLGQDQALQVPEVPTIKHASFSEQEMKEVLAAAAVIPTKDVQEDLTALEASTPPRNSKGARKPRERPPSLTLSTDDAVLIQALRPRSRFESVGAVNRFTDGEAAERHEVLKKHRAYAIYEEEPSIDEDNWSTKSIVDYDAIEPMAEIPMPAENSPGLGVARPRPSSGQSMIPRPMSSPVVSSGRTIARRPPSLALTDNDSENRSSQHSSSSTSSSLFSSLPRSSFTAESSPRSSPRQSVFDGKPEKPAFPKASGNIKKMFSNLFKKRENTRNSMRPFAKRTAGSSASVDATLSSLSLSASQVTLTPLALGTERDPFAASPPPPLRTPPPQPSPHARSASEASPLDSYSSMFAPVKAASRYPPKPLFGDP